MKRFLLYPLRGVFNALITIIFTVVVAVGVYIFALLVRLLPTKKLRHQGMLFLQKFPGFWIDTLSIIFILNGKKKWQIEGPTNLDVNRSYMLISNHSSWLDIWVLGYVFNRKTPGIKFFIKKELLWTLPFAGFATWILGFPFMERRSSSQLRKNPNLRQKDMETTHKACQKFIVYPSTIINFIEGTRFSKQKATKQNSPYENLLKPKAGGFAVVLHEMQGHLAGVINATIAYDPGDISFWNFCCGNFKKVICRYEVLEPPAELQGDYTKDREFRKAFQAWLNSIWLTKDLQLKQIKASHEPL